MEKEQIESQKNDGNVCVSEREREKELQVGLFKDAVKGIRIARS